MNILGKSISALKNSLAKKELNDNELLAYFQDRISSHDTEINSFVTLPEKPYKKHEGKLSGIPLAIKDNYCTEGLRTTASSKVLDNFIPPYSATVIKRLENAGAVIIGKTNMDAWAHGSSTETSDYGPTKNPWDKNTTAGGSSGGSAAAVSAYLAPASLGSETAGSIRQPAAWCGIVGLKPTYGRVSRYGVISMGSSFDCPGPMTLNVEDSALLLSIIAGKDEYDATSSEQPVDDYVGFLKVKKSYTIGIAEEYFEGVDETVKEKVNQSIEILHKLGHKVKKIKLISPKYAISVYTILQRSEVSSNLARYDGIRFGNDRSYFGKEAKKRIMLGTYTLSHGYYDAYYKKAQKVKTLIIEDFKRVFKEVDFIAAPTTPSTALKIGEFEKYPFFGEMMDVLNEPAAVAGIPAISLPVGWDKKGLPIGMQLMGNYFTEKDILNISQQFEQETNYYGVIDQGIKNYG